jgi:clan AA aspartic protease
VALKLIYGAVNQRLEGVLRLRLRGPGGREIHIDAIVDTAFSEFLTLPTTVVSALALPESEATEVRLADGSHIESMTYIGHVHWDGAWRIIDIQESDGDILLGMKLLRGTVLNVEVEVDGEVTITPFG